MGEVTDDSRLLVIGASARAAAYSAIRAGFTPVGIDLFGDVDLRAVADAQVATDYPLGLKRLADTVAPCRWLYTGGLENHPRTVAAISRRHGLLGNPPDVLRGIRNPFRVTETLQSAGLPVLDVRRKDNPPSADGRWVIKPRNSGGGRGIQVWNSDTAESATRNEPHFFQERFTGTPISAVYMASRLSCRLVGATRQLVGETDLHAAPFAYCGSLGPLQLNSAVMEQVNTIGRTLADAFSLRGLFGVDFLADKTTARVTEVNPRYTASVEVLEYALDTPLLSAHCLACENFENHESAAACESQLAALFAAMRPTNHIIGKAILFADRPFVAGETAEVTPCRSDNIPPERADIPQSGTAFQPGDPVCTVFATGDSITACLNTLFQNAYAMQEQFPRR